MASLTSYKVEKDTSGTLKQFLVKIMYEKVASQNMGSYDKVTFKEDFS